MRLVSFKEGGRSRVGVILSSGKVVGINVISKISGERLPATTIGFYKNPLEYLGKLEKIIENIGGNVLEDVAIEISKVKLEPPVPRPSKIVGVGLNYREHAEESGWKGRPTLFNKNPTAIIGPGEPIIIPIHARMVDYEAELVVVIGKRCKDVKAEEAEKYVLGFTCGNDVSARDWQFVISEGFKYREWYHAKGFDTFAPIGPLIATLEDVGDPNNLRIMLRLNNVKMQDSNTSKMIYNVWQLVEIASKGITLEPGDLIFTGTPSGVGFRREPPITLKHGDVVEVEIENIGILRNPVVEEKVLTKSRSNF